MTGSWRGEAASRRVKSEGRAVLREPVGEPQPEPMTMGEHLLRFRGESEWINVEIECTYDLDSPDRPCALYEDFLDTATPTKLMRGVCGVQHWYDETGLEAFEFDGVLSPPIRVDVTYEDCGYHVEFVEPVGEPQRPCTHVREAGNPHAPSWCTTHDSPIAIIADRCGWAAEQAVGEPQRDACATCGDSPGRLIRGPECACTDWSECPHLPVPCPSCVPPETP